MSQLSVFERIALGDPPAIKECMERFGGLVWSLARRYSESAADAEDAVQEIFIELWKVAGRYDPAAGAETAFVATIARRRLIDRLRRNERRPKIEPFAEWEVPDEAADPSESGFAAAQSAATQRALGSLDAAQREVLLMGIVEGMTHSEIAAVTGKPLGTVKTQIRRGLVKLRELMQQDAGAPLRGYSD